MFTPSEAFAHEPARFTATLFRHRTQLALTAFTTLRARAPTAKCNAFGLVGLSDVGSKTIQTRGTKESIAGTPCRHLRARAPAEGFEESSGGGYLTCDAIILRVSLGIKREFF